jgi:hypothetical protein
MVRPGQRDEVAFKLPVVTVHAVSSSLAGRGNGIQSSSAKRRLFSLTMELLDDKLLVMSEEGEE